MSLDLKEFIAGWAGGIAQVLVGQPFDTIKVRLQSNPNLYKSTLDCVKKCWTSEGPLAFYKGTLMPLIGIGGCVSIQFSALQSAKKLFGDDSIAKLFVCGAFSGCMNSILSIPVEHIRIRLQVQTDNFYKGPFDAIQKIYKGYGLQGIYKGSGITLVRESLGYGLYFGAYEQWMNWSGARKTSEPSPWRAICGGALAGYCMWIPCYPIDLIKSRIQTDNLGNRKYKSSIDCAAKVFKESGFIGFYRGLVPCLIRAAPVNAATFLTYELAMNAMK